MILPFLANSEPTIAREASQLETPVIALTEHCRGKFFHKKLLKIAKSTFFRVFANLKV
jgi:hypothetical protein